MTSRLVNRNVTVSGHRTSMRLEPELWDALAEIATREGRTINEICTEVDCRRRDSTLTGAIRVFIVTYFRALAQRSGAGVSVKPVGRNPSPRRRGGRQTAGNCDPHPNDPRRRTLSKGLAPAAP